MADASNGGGRIVPVVRPEEDAPQSCPPPTAPLQRPQQESQDMQQPKASKRTRNKLFEEAECLEIPCLNQLGLYALPTEGDGN